jgi:hypothetical protein
VYTFQVESFSHEGRGLRIMERILIILKKSMVRKFLFVMRCRVKQFKPKLRIKPNV